MKSGRVVKVSGPLVVADGMLGTKMYDVVYVGEMRLLGEVIELKGDRAYIQVYEDTHGVGPGDPVYGTGYPLMVELGPGLIESFFDGVQRPLDKIKILSGDFISRGIHVPALPRDKKWFFVPKVKKGDIVEEGDIIGEVDETTLVKHKIMVPPGINGVIEDIKEGVFTVEDVIAIVKDKEGNLHEIRMMQKWPVRIPRPYKEKHLPNAPMFTGQRVIDTFFPIAKGGTACVPGPFGSGKTVIQHQLAKWSDANIVVYIGCGERGNEMTDVLIEFPELKDPYSGEPLMKRTVLIANTSNMPVAAREASIYTGITIAEYFRDMGYSVALMADSTSRWAEALREISGRLEEMPGEEGYPAYLAARIASFYERAGRVTCLGSDNREGTLTVIGAVSPPGGDLSDPVVQSTLRVVKVFWSLEDKLAYRRHFPAINWLTSYSLYREDLKPYYERNVAPDFYDMVLEAMKILEKEAELEEIVRLVGAEALSQDDQLLLEIARSIREDFLHQNAFHEVDTFASIKKQYLMLKVILKLYDLCKEIIAKGEATVRDLRKRPIWEKVARMKYFSEQELNEIEKLLKEMDYEVRQPVS
jgi:V/A-type H+-transporting ATPase subunit A